MRKSSLVFIFILSVCVVSKCTSIHTKDGDYIKNTSVTTSGASWEIKMQMTDSVNSVAFSPDGKYILSTSDKSINLWDVTSGIMIRTFNGHTEHVNSVAYSPNGKYALSGSYDKTVKLWDIETGHVIWSFNGQFSEIKTVAFSPDGKYIVFGAHYYSLATHDEVNGTIKLLDITSGKVIRNFERDHTSVIEDDDIVMSVAFSPDGKYLVSGAWDKPIRLWDVSTGRVIRTFSGVNGGIFSIAFSPDGKYVLSGSANAVMTLWDITNGEQIRTYMGHKDGIFSVAFSPDGQYVLSSSKGRSIKLWNFNNGNEIRSFIGHSDNAGSVVFSPDGKYILSGSWDKTVKLWDVESGKNIRTFGKCFYKSNISAISPDMKYQATVLDLSIIQILEIKSGKKIKTFKGHSGQVESIIFSPDGKYVLSGSRDETAKLWDVESGKNIRTFKGLGSVGVVAFSSDGRRILTASKVLIVWDAISGKKIGSFTEKFFVKSAAFSADGKSVLYTFGRFVDAYNSIVEMYIWDIKSNEIIYTIQDKEMISSVAYAPNSRYVVAALMDKSLVLWDLQDKTCIRMNGHRDNDKNSYYSNESMSINCLSFSHDSKYIISGAGDNLIKLWDARNGREIKTFTGHSDSIKFLAFTPDDKSILSTDGTSTRIWNIETGQWVAFMSHSNGKDWLIFDSDGYWDASRHGGELVAMVKGMDCWNIDQFAVKNNRPDLILAKLPNSDKNLISEYNKQYRKRIAKLEKLYGIKETDLSSDMHVPKAEILKADQNGKKLNLSIKLTDSQYDIVSYNVYVNDVPVYTEIGKKISRKKELAVTETIELSSGENKIEVSCFNEKGAESYRTLTYATCEKEKKGNLYFIGFGVADYNDDTINDLKYAENDVHDLAKKFSGMKNDYDNVYVKTYTGKEVTPGNIKAAKDFVKNAGVDDTVILFISGHGMHDSDEFRTYYYLTQNTDMKNLKATAADFETVEDILAGINPRKKLFLMDTCDSGELDDFTGKKKFSDDKNSKGTPRTPKGIIIESIDNRGYFDRSRYIYNDLFRRTGAVVFSSSMGGEASWEFDALKNGAFTEAIIEGLSGKADADKNGTVTIDELRDYVSSSVGKYTDNRQHPVIDRDNIYINMELPAR